MRGTQRVIKYFAIALAMGIIALIITTLTGVGILVGRWTGVELGEDSATEPAHELASQEFEEVRPQNLEIEVGLTDVEIVRGEKFQVQYDAETMDLKLKGDTLALDETEQNWFWSWSWPWAGKNQQRRLVIYLPEEVKFGKVMIETGAGEVKIAGLKTDELGLKLGAGKASVERIVADRAAVIDGGAGMLEILDCELKNLDFDMGVGKVEMRAKLMGQSKIDAGAGELKLDLIGTADDYRVVVDSGIGSVSWDGLEANNAAGENLVKIDGGVGAIRVGVVESGL